jgi:hypothetical protein
MLEKTPAYKILKNASLLNDALAWFDIFKNNYDLKAEIVRMITEDQLFQQGVDGNDRIIGYYSPTTEQLSRGRKKAGKPYTLFDTGEFYRSIFVVTLYDSLVIKGDSTRFENQRWFRDEIVKLSDENLTIFVDELLRDKYIKYVKRILFTGR